MFEHRHEPLVPRPVFAFRMLRHFAIATGVVSGSLAIGMAGYHFLEGLAWIDAFVNSAMLLGGMGPVNELHTDAGKAFAGCYALFAGLIFLIAIGVFFAPLFHRFLHRFHLELASKE
jgi:hypothetical protein